MDAAGADVVGLVDCGSDSVVQWSVRRRDPLLEVVVLVVMEYEVHMHGIGYGVDAVA